jgi:hypothetical protein
MYIKLTGNRWSDNYRYRVYKAIRLKENLYNICIDNRYGIHRTNMNGWDIIILGVKSYLKLVK